MDAKTGMKTVLSIVLQHTADIFEGVVDAIAESYHLDKEEMMDIIRKHPKFTEPILHPALAALGTPATAAAPEPTKPKKFQFRKN